MEKLHLNYFCRILFRIEFNRMTAQWLLMVWDSRPTLCSPRVWDCSHTGKGTFFEFTQRHLTGQQEALKCAYFSHLKKYKISKKNSLSWSHFPSSPCAISLLSLKSCFLFPAAFLPPTVHWSYSHLVFAPHSPQISSDQGPPGPPWFFFFSLPWLHPQHCLTSLHFFLFKQLLHMPSRTVSPVLSLT